MQVKCKELISPGACKTWWVCDSPLLTLTFAVGDWVVCFLVIPVKNLNRFSFDSCCYLFSNRKPLKYPFYCFLALPGGWNAWKRHNWDLCWEEGGASKGAKGECSWGKPCCPATSIILGVLWLRLSKLQEPHGRGQLLTQTLLCQEFSPLPLYLASASRRNSWEDGDPDLLWASTKEPWGWGCSGISYGWSQPQRKANSGNKGHRGKRGYHLKESLCCTRLPCVVLLSILKSKPIALGWEFPLHPPPLAPSPLSLKIKKAAAVQPSVCVRTEPAEGSCRMGKLLCEDAWKINNGASAQCEAATWHSQRKGKGETIYAWHRQEPAFPSLLSGTGFISMYLSDPG